LSVDPYGIRAASAQNGENIPAAIGFIDETGQTGLELWHAKIVSSRAAVKAGDEALLEWEVIIAINEERATEGVSPLVQNSLLTNAARGHSADMANNNFFSHTGSDGSNAGDRIIRTGYDWITYGENIAAGYGTAGEVVNGWMNSPGHRANILNPDFREIGVGYAYNASSIYGTYWTADFGTSWSSPLPGPTPVSGTNYANLAGNPLGVNPGESISLGYTCYASMWGYSGVPVDVYVAAIKDPQVSDVPSTVEQALAGGRVYLFGAGMSSVYIYNGSVGAPTFSGVKLPSPPVTGSLPVTAPVSPGYAGNYVFATAFIRRDNGRFVRTDLPVENSNSFTLH